MFKSQIKESIFSYDNCTWRITLLISSFTGKVNDWQVPWKHQRTIPPFEKIVNKSNILTVCLFPFTSTTIIMNQRFSLVFSSFPFSHDAGNQRCSGRILPRDPSRNQKYNWSFSRWPPQWEDNVFLEVLKHILPRNLQVMKRLLETEPWRN